MQQIPAFSGLFNEVLVQFVHPVKFFVGVI